MILNKQITNYDGNKSGPNSISSSNDQPAKHSNRANKSIYSSNRMPKLQNLDSSLSGLFTKRRNISIAEKLNTNANTQHPIEAYRINIKEPASSVQPETTVSQVRNKHLFNILSSKPKLHSSKTATKAVTEEQPVFSNSSKNSLSASIHSSMPIRSDISEAVVATIARVHSSGSCNLDDTEPSPIYSNSSSFRQSSATIPNTAELSLSASLNNNSSSIIIDNTSGEEPNSKSPSSNLTSIPANGSDYVITRL